MGETLRRIISCVCSVATPDAGDARCSSTEKNGMEAISFRRIAFRPVSNWKRVSIAVAPMLRALELDPEIRHGECERRELPIACQRIGEAETRRLASVPGEL